MNIFKMKIYFVIEKCDNSLSDFLRNKNDGYNIKEIFEIMSQLNKTFKILKENKIVLRVIKLDNILIKKEKKDILKYICKLTYYGISKKMNDYSNLRTYTGTTIAMAPEILKMEI